MDVVSYDLVADIDVLDVRQALLVGKALVDPLILTYTPTGHNTTFTTPENQRKKKTQNGQQRRSSKIV